MAITSINAMMGQGDRSATLDVGQGKAYVARYRVITNTQNDGPAAILQGFGALYGQKYIVGYPGGGSDADTNAYLSRISCEQASEDGIEWHITLAYSWYDANTVGGGPEQNPLLMPIEVKWGWRDQDLPIDIDINGDPVLNTAGDPLDPPVTINDPRILMTVTRNEPVISLALIQQYRNAINSDAWAGYQPLFAHCLGITPANVFHQLVGWYYQVTYEFEFMTARQAANQGSQGGELQGFRKQIVNQGFRALDNSGKKYHVVYRGIPVSQPVLLDKDGKELPLSGKPVINVFKAYPELPFTDAFNFDELAITGQRSGFPAGGGGGQGGG